MAKDINGAPLKVGDKIKRVAYAKSSGFSETTVYIVTKVHDDNTISTNPVSSHGDVSWMAERFIKIANASKTSPIKRNTNLRK